MSNSEILQTEQFNIKIQMLEADLQDAQIDIEDKNKTLVKLADDNARLTAELMRLQEIVGEDDYNNIEKVLKGE